MRFFIIVFHRRLSSWVPVVLLDLQFLQGPIPQFLQGPVCVVIVAITSHSSWPTQVSEDYILSRRISWSDRFSHQVPFPWPTSGFPWQVAPGRTIESSWRWSAPRGPYVSNLWPSRPGHRRIEGISPTSSAPVIPVYWRWCFTPFYTLPSWVATPTTLLLAKATKVVLISKLVGGKFHLQVCLSQTSW